jgi:hypothetical protein
MFNRIDRRTLLAIVLMVPMFALMIVMMGCLPVPVGDPDNSTPDEALNGAWIQREDDKETLYMVQSYDKHTHLVRYYNFKRNGDAIEAGDHGAYRGWITQIAGVAFLTLEPKPLPEAWGEKDSNPKWIVGKYRIDGPSVIYNMVKADAEQIKNAANRSEAEAVLAANANNAALFGDSTSFRKASRDEAKEILAAFKAQ